jgi:hypothetical protein
VVDDEVMKTEPDLVALASMLRTATPAAARAPEPGSAAEKKTAEADDRALRERAERTSPLTAASNATEMLAEEVRAFLDYAAAQPPPNLTACRDLVPAEAAKARAIEVAPESTTLKPGKSGVLAVTGGAPPYAVSLLGQAGDALEEKQDSSGAVSRVTVTAKSGAATGTYDVLVSDVTGSRKIVKVEVKP